MMRQRVVGLGDANLRIGAATELAPDHERDHPGDISPIGEHLQVEHQTHLLLERLWNARRLLDQRHLGCPPLLRGLDSPLMSNGREILVNLERSLGPRPRPRSTTASVIESRMLRCRR